MSKTGLDSKTKGRYKRHDAYYHAAKKQGFLARSIFKLEEIDNNFKILNSKDWVLDLGCSPGSWLQYVDSKIGKKEGGAIGVDLLPLKVSFRPQIHFVNADILEVDIDALRPRNALELPEAPMYFDVILSDMAPNMSGIKSLDQDRSMGLCEHALYLADHLLKPGGNFCIKVLEGGGMPAFIKACREVFLEVKIKRPKGTRVSSMETYVIGLKRKKR